MFIFSTTVFFTLLNLSWAVESLVIPFVHNQYVSLSFLIILALFIVTEKIEEFELCST
ncbi:hypothetical protein [Mycoplasmopsis canis]|uniref:hypothetical protein n=1 Tax=Mycoplasmopsis canis TaxID=29555 RepID=UPI001F216C56|nr:hypothetical protein [Mycoplasmopsis canis]